MDGDLDRELTRLRDALARAGATLLALEQDSTLQLLDAATLSGRTAARWGDVAASRAALFRAHHELSDVLERAAAGRSRDAAQVLCGPSVVLVDVAQRLTDRGLLDGSRRIERGTPDQLLAAMTGAFADVRVVVSAVERTWAEAIPWIRDARLRLADLGAEAEVLGTDVPAAADGLAATLDDLAEQVLADPLAWSPTDVAGIDDRLAEAGAALATLRSVSDHWPAQLDDARQLLGSLSDMVARAEETRARARSRVVGVTSTADGDPSGPLAAELDALADLAGAAAWPDVATGLAAWRDRTEEALADARVRAAEHQALLDQRDELRGRLDAYEAKAERHHRLEDAELSALYRRAYEALYTAPADLDQAGELVRRYQAALTTGGRR